MNRFATLLWVGFLTLSQALAGEARFFRLVSPAPTSIIAVTPTGTVTWTNAQTGITCTFQATTDISGGTGWNDYVQVPVSSSNMTLRLFDPAPPVGMRFIPAGSFTMGDTLDGDWNAKPVTAYVSAVYMDVNLVSWSQWQSVYFWATNHGYDFEHPGSGKAANHPVQTLNWYDVVKWCNARSEKDGRVPAYYTDAGQTVVYRSGTNDLMNNWVKWNTGFRLPTEAEWEKAARGGLGGHRFPWGDTISESQANYYSGHGYIYDLSNTGYNPIYNDGVYPYTSPVGTFAANLYGLYDMAGNASEWCWDWYKDSYAGGHDPRGPVSVGPYYYWRVKRGGGWYDYAYGCRVSVRAVESPASGNNDSYGFRSVLGADQP